MINEFTTEATKAVYDTISNRPDLFEQAVQLVTERPADAPKALRSWAEKYIANTNGNDLAQELLRASLKQVRWNELRQVLQRDAKRYHS